MEPTLRAADPSRLPAAKGVITTTTRMMMMLLLSSADTSAHSTANVRSRFIVRAMQIMLQYLDKCPNRTITAQSITAQSITAQSITAQSTTAQSITAQTITAEQPGTITQVRPDLIRLQSGRELGV
ncbi:hypothetical protein [Frigoribacterium sp. CG_9.8]|uniref:hypothetical protein n=1 Tax=Frigoribacterium sp. CG_9.8 TaxID=2787733 RepID=UPI0018C9AD47|nr:hypothetical protein [Frigoribacterium sp. CG_9.8]MBG6107093.1 hypothetical protein [Frigoribacterium sp. CG_9.8]